MVTSYGFSKSLCCFVHALKRVEELRGPPVDSYDKLIAWLAEMAKNDNVHLDTSVFVKQLNSVCGSTPTTSRGLNSLAAGGSDRGSSGTGLNAATRRNSTLRQNSTSCESRASSSDTHHFSTGRSTYSRSFDDTLDPRQAWRHHAAFSSRQGTCSDDLEEDPDVRNASMESLYSGSDRDSEVEAMASAYSCEPSASRRARFSQQREQRDMRRPLLRQAILSSSTCSSTGEAESARGAGSFSESSHTAVCSMNGKHSGYGSCSISRSSMVTLSSTLMPEAFMPCSASTGDLDKLNTAMEEASGEQSPVTVLARRRSVSLLNLTPPGRATYYVPDAGPPDTPPAKVPPTEMFLDDTLLDGNLADILFSVEALWPKK